MLGSHFNAIEEALLAQSKIAANAGHPLHKGTPREIFLREFLFNHLPSTVDVGTGEIIDARSKPNEPRNQFDIVIFRKEFPKLRFAEGVYGFMAESVVATIEVKSTLDKDGVLQTARAASRAKNLNRSSSMLFSGGYVPPAILNIVVAYDGPANMETAARWIAESNETLGITPVDLPSNVNERLNTPAPSIDAVIVLKRGYVAYDNLPISLLSQAGREAAGKFHWCIVDAPGDNLLFLFLLLQTALANVQGLLFNPLPYVRISAAGIVTVAHEGPLYE